MTTIAEFITARLDEDEQIASAVIERAWTDTDDGVSNDGTRTNNVCWIPDSAQTWPIGEHIARHDPSRALADVAAKRRTLARHTGEGHQCVKEIVGYSVQAWYDEDDPCPDLRDLAAPYAELPGYKDEWRP
jgi:hypothetical protein